LHGFQKVSIGVWEIDFVKRYGIQGKSQIFY